MDFEVEVDLDEVKQVIEAPEFAQYLLSHTTQFSSAAFILQTLLDAIDNAVQSLDNTENI
jgi:F0F1-type ATP synthase delta subunit